MPAKQYTFLFLIFFLLSSLLPGQEVAFEHFRVGREAPFSTVYGQIVQDQKGYLWLGTDQGVYRFDGDQFQYIPITSAIADEEILYLFFSEDGTLWIENLNRQLGYLLPDADSLQLLQLPDSIYQNIKRLDKYEAGYFYFNSRALINGRRAIYRASRPNGMAASELDIFYHSIPYSDIEYCTSGKMYTSQLRASERDSQIVCHVHYKGDSTKIAEIKLQHTLNASPSFIQLPYTKKMALDPGSNYDFPVLLFDTFPPYQSIVIEKEEGIRVSQVTDDCLNNTWICTDNGILGYDANYEPLFDGKPLLEGRVINNIFRDREGGYWAGTEKDGLYYIPNLHTRFYSSDNSSLPSDNITVLSCSANEVIYGGTLHSDLFKIWDNKIEPMTTLTSEQSSIWHIRSIEEHGDYLYIVMDGATHYRYGLKNKIVQTVDLNKGGKTISSYQQQMVLGSNVGVFLFSMEELEKPVRQLTENRTNSILGDPAQQRVWISDTRNLNYYDFRSDSLISIHTGQQKRPRFIVDLVKDRQDILWAASANEGIYGIQGDSLRYHFSTQDGLSSNNCRRLFIDQDQSLWVGTNEGVNRIDLHTFSIQAIDRSDGLLAEDVMDLARSKDRLWVGTPEGLFSIPVQANYLSASAPLINITRFKVWEQDTLLQPCYSLPYYANNLYIEFQGINFRNQEKMCYRYRMIGIDSNWTNLQSENNFVRFPQLQSGDYQFEVTAVNNEGQTSPVAILEIKIKQAFWQSWWFILLSLLGVFGLVQWILYGIRQRRAKEEQYLRRIEQLRSVALRSQMNPHFIFNTLNAILFFLIQNNWKSSVKYLSKFSRLIRSIFDHSRYDRITLSEEIQFLENYLELENLRFADKVQIQKHIDPQLRNSSIMVPPLFIQPILENAFKHGLFHKGKGGLLEFSIRELKDHVHINIKDNGIGRTKAQEINERRNRVKAHSSGRVLEERIELINSKSGDKRSRIQLKTTDLKSVEGKAIGTQCEIFIYF